MEKTNNITIIGKRWFDRINGNTYFSAVGLIDGKEVVNLPFQYGYGDQYEWETFRELEKGGFLEGIKRNSNGSSESLWEYCERNGITKYSSVSDVRRKKDL